MSMALLWTSRSQALKNTSAMNSQRLEPNTLDELSSCPEDLFTSCSIEDSSQRSLMLLEGIDGDFEIAAGDDLAYEESSNGGGGSDSFDLDAIDAHGDDAEQEEIEVDFSVGDTPSFENDESPPGSDAGEQI